MVDLAGDLRHGGADGVGDCVVRHADDVGDAVHALRRQHRRAANREQWQIAGLGLLPVDRLGQHAVCLGDGVVDECCRQMRDAGFLADLDQSRRHCDIREGQCLAAEHQGRTGEPVANAARADGQWIGDDGTAAQADRQQVGHAKQGAHTADHDYVIGRARIAGLEAADIAGGATNIDHHGVLDAGQQSGAAHRVGRP